MHLVKIKRPIMNMHFDRGFSVIEILIVLIVIVILTMIALPSYQESVRKARRAEGRAALMQLMQQEERYYSQNTSYTVFSSNSTDASEKMFKWFSGENAVASAYEIDAVACVGEKIEQCVLLTARPGTTKVNVAHVDAVCGNLSLTSTGVKSAAAENCW